MGQVLRGFAVGSRGYGYTSVPHGESKYDKKGRLRADGFKLVVVAEEARVVQRIYRDFITGKAITKIAKEMNDERVPTKARLKGGWNVSTISRILKDDKYVGKFVWNRTTTLKDPMSGKMKQVDRPKEEWVVQERAEMRILQNEEWEAAQRRWVEIDGVFPSGKGKKGFEGKRRSYVDSHPTHLLSASLKCGSCGGAIALVSGKGSGYYGCLNASRRSCENKVLIARKRLEDKFVAALSDQVLKPEVLHAVYERTAKKIKELFAHVPEELRLKKVELNRAETRVHNFIEFIASGRATPGLAGALGQAEEQVKTLSADVVSMESTKDHAFTPPPRPWIADRLTKLHYLLGKRTEQSALALRRLTGPVTLTPKRPEVGRPYFMVDCKFDSLNLLADGGSNLLQWWRRWESKSAKRSLATWRGRFVSLTRPCFPAASASQRVLASLRRSPRNRPVLGETPESSAPFVSISRPAAIGAVRGEGPGEFALHRPAPLRTWPHRPRHMQQQLPLAESERIRVRPLRP